LSDHTLKYRIALIDLPEIAHKTRDGHYEIYQALMSKKPTQVDEAIRSHLQLAKQDIRELLERKRHEAFISENLGG